MFFHKFPAPANFLYPAGYEADTVPGGIRLSETNGFVSAALLEGGVVRLTQCLGAGNDANDSVLQLGISDARHSRVSVEPGQARLEGDGVRLEIATNDGSFRVLHQGAEIVASRPRPFGLSGRRQMLLLDWPGEGVVAYGLGEKTGKLDKAGRAYSFWNTDVVAEHPHTFMGDTFDPAYASIPFLITRRGDSFFGVFLNNPRMSWIYPGLRHREGDRFTLGWGLRDLGEPVCALATDGGSLEAYILPGPTLADVVRRFARLTGTHPVPPRWALGYHQCRWSYMSAEELDTVSRRLDDAGVPVGAMWMDIDYMHGFRVFTFDPDRFAPKQRERHFSAIKQRGTRLVTIVDPGVKAEQGYHVFDEGTQGRLFCETANGIPYVGTVWPGTTVFPDFSLGEARRFWAGHVAGMLEAGIDGIWNDMNDPSTGPIDYAEMRFGHGTKDHDAFHNQYANLMAEATVEGFRRKDGDLRPFVLTRSASPGIQRVAAVWTGDNASNPVHLAQSIPMSLNLALSGVSFNGPDVGGFACDTTEELMVAWNLAGFLFPFFRNHTAIDSRAQEPDAFSPATLDLIRRCINTRSKLMPYLYSLFHQHARTGDAVMRPLAWEFPGAEFERISDQFLLGPSLMAAPFVDLESGERAVVLPPGWWYDMAAGEWLEGGRTITVERSAKPVLFVRDGAVLPCLPGTRFRPDPEWGEIEVHVFQRKAEGAFRLFEDDGISRAHESGAFRETVLRVTHDGSVSAEVVTDGYPGAARLGRVFHYGSAPPGSTAGAAEWPFGSHGVQVSGPGQ